MRIAKLIFLLVLAGAASALSSPVYTRRRILQDDSTIVDPYEKPLKCIGSSKWVYNGTIVGVVEGGEGKKKMTWEKCCELCYKNPYCYFWQRGSNKEGQRCVMFSQTAARYEAKMVPCTCSRVSGKSPIVGGRVELIAMDEEERPDAHGKTQDVVKKMDSMLAKSAKSIDKKLEKLKEKYEKQGIVYISRLPPHLKPQKLRHMLEQQAPLGRLYLAPEEPSTRKKRKQRGGNSGKNFTEGWVEFEDKADAKRVAAMLNGQQMGGKRRSAHYFDLWNIKYLPKFKWDHLTEEINYQKAIREQRLATEVAAAKRERDFYLSRVDKAKAVESIIERKKRKRDTEDGDGDGEKEAGSSGKNKRAAAAASPAETRQRKKTASAAGSTKGNVSTEDTGPRVLRTYGQRQSKADPVNDADAPMLSRGLLQMIAGKKKKK